MLIDMLSGLQLLTGTALLWMLAGVVIGVVAAIIPGLGGLFGIAIVLPLAFTLGPVAGIALIVAVGAMSGTGNTITSILYGIPGSAGGVASTFDGFPMARRGEGIRAVSAGLSSSVIGGFIGAVVLALSLPILREIVLLIRSPEFFVMILLAMVFMAFADQQTDPLRGLVSGGVGLMLAFIGLEISTGTQRYTFGELYLWDGVPLIAVILGLYAITEMIDLMRGGSAIASGGTQERWWAQMKQGLIDPVRYWGATLQSSAAGLWVGIAPGLGDTAAQFVGYSQAQRTAKHPEEFGKGSVEGVIAADAAANAKEGGALIPTLAFGIPGSASMAIFIAAFLAFGIQPGPEMLTQNVDIVWMIIWILVIGNVAGALLCLAITPGMAKLTELRTSLLVPPILIASIFGAYSARNSLGDVLVLMVAGYLGWVLKHTGYSRAIFLIGFVLGQPLERNYLLAVRLYGLDVLTRPLTVVFLALIVWVLLGPVVKRVVRAARR